MDKVKTILALQAAERNILNEISEGTGIYSDGRCQQAQRIVRESIEKTIRGIREGTPIGDPSSLGLEPIPEWMRGNTVEARNALQHSGRVHPYTCRDSECRTKTNQAPLRAVENGWICDFCGYTQNLEKDHGKP